MKDTLKEKRGITLVALVVTIIVLIILAGVSIALVLGDNGIVTRSQLAKKEYANAEAYEKEQMDSVVNEMDIVVGSSRDTTVKTNYRTDGTETETNEYLDGKKIYSKYITTTISTSGWKDDEHNIQNVEKIWINTAKSYVEDDGFYNALPMGSGGATYRVNATKVGTYSISEHWNGTTAILLLEYTKTTDTPIAM